MGDDLAKRMLSLAREDEVAARALLPLDGVANSIVGFHCQQAVEKALKSALASREVKFPNTHDLAGLAELCQRSGLDLPEGLQGIQHLAPYGVQMRYASAPGDPLDREQAVRWAGAAVEWAAGVERSRDARDLWPSRTPHDRADR